MFEGEIHHEDFLGNSGIIRSGDLQVCRHIWNYNIHACLRDTHVHVY